MRRPGLLLLVALLVGAGAAAPADVTTPAAGPETFSFAPGRLLDVYRPARPAPRPAVVLVHGGGWRSGDRTWWAAQARRVRDEGWVAVSVDYRLAPAHPFPAARDDLRAALAWLRRRAAALGVDPTRVALVGGSAGGNLALLTALSRAEPGVVAAVSWSGPTDLAALRGRRLAPLVAGYLGCAPTACPSRAAAASPVTHVSAGDPPLLLANARDEIVPLSQLRALEAAAHAAGVPVEVLVVPGRAHATQYGAQVWAATTRFLARSFS